ncbi:transcriptional regulator [Brachybacterium phenoliresistens]|uniref:Transcriptional regulator n=1 Tax=Brachybacterium phenoliresistens TaxID=396014 RepID=Z9JSF0_9MICO|nr:response regulator transcription factor [Brachybacterium phenoliresistens]EWS80943.1 transcriptional regulator [Brachybacterium phenoliresistens]
MSSAEGPAPWRVVVVDDHELLRRGLRLVLETIDDLAVVGEAADGHEALAVIAARAPDVVITDARMPGLDGLGLVRACTTAHPGLPLLVLTTFEDAALVRALVDAGAAGYLLKDIAPDRLAESVRAVAVGGLVLDPRIARHARSPGPEDDAAAAPLAILTRSERAVAGGVAQGRTNGEIAASLHLAEGTVKNHVSALLRKLEARDRTALALQLAKALGRELP